MNAAFLLVTSAMVVGQAGGDKKVEAVQPPAKVAPAPVVSGCGHDPCGCDGFGHRLRDRLRGLFNRDCCDSCQPSCAPARAPIFQGHAHNHCAPATCNDPCGRTGFNILERLRGGFHRHDSCCDGGCSSPAAPAKTEKIADPPKKMPDPKAAPKAGDKKPQEVRIDTPVTPIVPNAIPTVPTVEVTPLPIPAPTPAPRIEGDRRDPF